MNAQTVLARGKANGAWGPGQIPSANMRPQVPDWFRAGYSAANPHAQMQPHRVPAIHSPHGASTNPFYRRLHAENAPPQYVPNAQRFQGLNVDHLGFALSQTAHIEMEVYRIKYDNIQYHQLVPIDTRAHQWARTITHFSQDRRGKMEPVAGNSNRFPRVELDHSEYNLTVEMFGVAYGWNIEELGQASMIPGMQLTSDKAAAARRASEEFLDQTVLEGNSQYGWDSLIKSTKPNKSDAPNGASSSPTWQSKTAEEIILDINTLLQSVYTDTNTVDLANTLLLPPNIWSALTSKVLDGTSTTVTEFIKRNNVYTMKTGNQLMIREVNGLQDAAAGGKGRAVAYKRNREVLRLHLPMPLRLMRR